VPPSVHVVPPLARPVSESVKAVPPIRLSIFVKPPPIDASVPAKPCETPSDVRVTLSGDWSADQSRALGPVPPSIAPVTLAALAKTKSVTPPPP